MEWGLPRWLGEAFDLSETTIHDLILANVFLLGFVRITDDLIDEVFLSPEPPPIRSQLRTGSARPGNPPRNVAAPS